MKIWNYKRKIVYDTDTQELLTFEEFEKQQEQNEQPSSL
jgi:hypothetical protein